MNDPTRTGRRNATLTVLLSCALIAGAAGVASAQAAPAPAAPAAGMRASSVFGTTGSGPNSVVVDSAGNVYTTNTTANNVTKIKHATKKLADLKQKIQKYDAELKLSRAEAELAKLAHTFNFDVTTDFGQIEDVIQDKIGLNRAKVRVAADLSGEGLEQIKQEEAVEKAMADKALREFEIEMGMVTPETAGVSADDKELGTERARQTQG